VYHSVTDVPEIDRIGQILGGKYRVLRVLGKGGMGAVYVAEHVEIGKQVAVKLLHHYFAANADVVRRFSQEARAAAAIGHRGIIDVHDVGTTDDGAPYIVMELLQGESLRGALEREPVFAVDRAVSIVLRVLSALRAAHAKGIVHRDLKPDNVFLEGPLGRPGMVKLLDFGISKMTMGEEGGGHATRTGVALGTPHYMAPEQARGRRDIDHRVDVWAAGVMLYELVTGRTPFGGDNYNAVIAEIVTETIPSPRTLRPDLPEDLTAAIMRALESDRDVRFGSAEAFARAISQHAGAAGGWDENDMGETQLAQAASPSRSVPATRTIGTGSSGLMSRSRRKALLAAGIVVGIGAVGVVAWSVSQPAAQGRDTRRTAEPQAAREPEKATEVAAGVVTIEIVGAPDEARVFFEDAEVAGRSIRVAPKDAMVPLRVELDGYEPFARMVTPDHDQRIEVTLEPIAQTGPRRGTRKTALEKTTKRTGTPILTGTEEFGDE